MESLRLMVERSYLLLQNGIVEGEFKLGPFSEKSWLLFFIPGIGWIPLLIYILSLALRGQLNAFLTLLAAIALSRTGFTDPTAIARGEVSLLQLVLILFATANILLILTAPKVDLDIYDEEGLAVDRVRSAMPVVHFLFLTFKDPRRMQ